MGVPRTDIYSQIADWVITTARRKPEALLLLVAGCALLMRSTTGRRGIDTVDAYDEDLSSHEASGSAGAFSGVRKAAETAAQRVAEIRDRVGDRVDARISSAGDYVEDARRRVGDVAGEVRQNLRSVAEEVGDKASSLARTSSGAVRDHPVLIAAFGLVIGAGLAAIFLPALADRRTLRRASERLVGAARQVGKDMVDGAVRAGERVQRAAAELTPGGPKDAASEAGKSVSSSPEGERTAPPSHEPPPVNTE